MIKNALRIGRLLAFSSLLSATLTLQIAAREAAPAALGEVAGWATSAPCCVSVASEAIAEATSPAHLAEKEA
jgi:hypothetical protein